jgi:hypothetical protein
MKPARSYQLLWSLFLGIAILVLSGCEGNDVHVSLAQNGKIVLNPIYSDKIRWAPGVQVHFLIPGLCQERDTWITTCTVRIKVQPGDFGQFNYICKGGICKDPEVDVGSSTAQPDTYAKMTRAAWAAALNPDVQVALPCDLGSGTITPTPADVPGDLYGPITSGTVVQWVSNGNGSVLLKDWTVTFDAGNATVCNEADIHNAGGYRSCTIKDGLAAGPYKYTAASPQCKSGSGSVTVSPK